MAVDFENHAGLNPVADRHASIAIHTDTTSTDIESLHNKNTMGEQPLQGSLLKGRSKKCSRPSEVDGRRHGVGEHLTNLKSDKA
jgi:hypothetical protein